MEATQSAASPNHGRPDTIAVLVNRHEVTFDERHATGLLIKETAIAQGVTIQRDFLLYEVKGPGKLDPVGDDDRVTLHPLQEFRAVAPDDNSQG